LTIDPASDASGLRLLRSPKYTANLGVQYETSFSYGRIVASTNVYLTDDFYFDSNEQVPQDGYTLVNLRTVWFSPSEQFDVAVFLNNATDEEYYAQVSLVEHSASQTYGEPRSFGVSFGYRW
ncbi:MAG: TonB-dependent receptor domain-containing protein, partial [Parahaliea sp.]